LNVKTLEKRPFCEGYQGGERRKSSKCLLEEFGERVSKKRTIDGEDTGTRPHTSIG